MPISYRQLPLLSIGEIDRPTMLKGGAGPEAETVFEWRHPARGVLEQ